MRLQVSIEADNTEQAQMAAAKWARYNRVTHYEVWADHPVIKVVDGLVLIAESCLTRNYIPLPEP